MNVLDVEGGCCGSLRANARPALESDGHILREVVASVGDGAALVGSPYESEERAGKQCRIDVGHVARRPERTRQQAEKHADGEHDSAGHVTRNKGARISASISEQEAKREREQTACKGEGEHEARGLAQVRAECAGDFKQRNQDEQADGQMHGEGMKAAEKLLPVSVRLAVEMNEPGKKRECHAQREGGEP